jgi:Carboxypeptidase regulatory-like domain
MAFSVKLKALISVLSAAAVLVIASTVTVHASTVTIVHEKNGNLGIIRGIVRDNSGSPISDATVAIFRLGTSNLLKQVRSATDGSFLAKIIPGTYTVLAVAQGFNPVTLSDVEVNKAADVVYGFRLERAGSGNTLPEKRLDRNSSKWRIRAAQSQRSIYQNTEGDSPVASTDPNVTVEESADTAEEPASNRRGQTVIETYAADTRGGSYGGVNFATLLPVTDDSEVIIAGQVGKGANAPLRVETEIKYRPNEKHQLRFNTSFGKLGSVVAAGEDRQLGQFSFQALDEWKVREGVILVFGVDYSRFTGAGDDFSISPRLGLQYDLDSKTRVRTAFTSQTEDRSWARAVELEDSAVFFREPVAIDDLVIRNGKPKMNKSTRFELGIERVLDNRSSIDANVFFDTTLSRGVGLNALPFDVLNTAAFSDIVADQQGGSQGVRVVYNRRLSGMFSTSAGYSFGSGQRLSSRAISDPGDVFENAVFQTFFGQIAAQLRTGTNVKTVYRLSSQATVFAIDPFKGRLAIYDPGLSVLVTQSLPNLGLPFRAEAIVDARNLFDFQGGVATEAGQLRLSGQRRMLRGGILVRF